MPTNVSQKPCCSAIHYPFVVVISRAIILPRPVYELWQMLDVESQRLIRRKQNVTPATAKPASYHNVYVVTLAYRHRLRWGSYAQRNRDQGQSDSLGSRVFLV